jgi:hypothetical protein
LRDLDRWRCSIDNDVGSVLTIGRFYFLNVDDHAEIAPSSAPTSVAAPSGCPDDPVFRASVLPKGFDKVLKVGRAHQIPWDATVRYYSGPPGAFIDIYALELPAWRPSTVVQLPVLNTTGQFGEVEDGYSFSFVLPCGPYTLLSSGVSADEFKAVITGLTLN